MVFNNFPSPSRAKYSHCIGIITEGEQKRKGATTFANSKLKDQYLNGEQ